MTSHCVHGEEIFSQLDGNRNGSLSRSELVKVPVAWTTKTWRTKNGQGGEAGVYHYLDIGLLWSTMCCNLNMDCKLLYFQKKKLLWDDIMFVLCRGLVIMHLFVRNDN